jgi:hypothetical protein
MLSFEQKPGGAEKHGGAVDPSVVIMAEAGPDGQ